jgi:hypothetical protein
MKSLKLRLLAVLIGTVLTLGLSHAVAQASCYDRIAGGNAYGDYDCRYTSECAGWCYYSCTCSNLFPGFNCSKVLEEAGFELVQGPQC